ncbi:hypothetical protein [Kineosporia babensis]|uniref:Uncharacterized protein n=1 Tax=Kineosporia babensis TaxID=499548 RepID=A0A9X1N8Z9_9ACTN|nr:hypothetical protein [Kineosporia babensis]MCD5310612.1 hypothetical protein [Kineosporia babensis]
MRSNHVDELSELPGGHRQLPDVMASGPGTFVVPSGSARRVLLATVEDALRRVRLDHVRRTVPVQGGNYRQTAPWELPVAATLAEANESLDRRIIALGGEFPELRALLRSIAEPVQRLRQPLAQALTATTEVLAALAGLIEISDGEQTCRVEADGGSLRITLPVGSSLMTSAQFLAAVAALQRRARQQSRPLSAAELMAEQAAHLLLAGGARFSGTYRSWGTVGFRDHQTYMSVTDPGEGHLDGTLREMGHLDGVIVHIEHLERGTRQTRGAVEPYRIPYPPMVARIRLALGADAPSSSYVGRPVFEHGVETGMLKAVHTVAAACSELFAEGLSECKIAIEGMSATQAIRYMRHLSAAVRRDRFTQVLSAAVNLNTPLLDDRGKGGPTLVEDRLAIGRLGIRLAQEGRFDKVTWDGSGNSYPSGCVLEQITPAEALTLVHEAHERGLLTYFSAGFRMPQVRAAVFTGVDGVGIGGAQILRYMDAETGHHGPFLTANIATILEVRNAAEADVRGRGAALLARLDRMAFELSIGRADNSRRHRLFRALGDRDDASVEALLRTLSSIEQMPHDSGPSLLGWVERLRAAGPDSLFALLVPDWQSRLKDLNVAAAAGDLEYLAEQLLVVRSFSSQSRWASTA